MSERSGTFRTVDRRAASQPGPASVLDSQGRVISGFGQSVTQEQVLDKMGEHFRNTIERARTGGKLRTVQDHANLFKELSTWAETQYGQLVKQHEFPNMDRRQLLQAMAERGELSTMKAGLERLGLRNQAESLARRVRDARGMDRAEFQQFVNKFVDGRIELRALIEGIPLKPHELDGIKKAFINNKEVYNLLKAGRDFGVVAGYSYKHAAGAVEASGVVRRAARQFGKSNLAELMGSATWAADMLRGGQGTLEQHLIRSHTAKHSRITTYLNVQRLAAITVALGIGYYALRAGSCVCGAIGATGAKEGARPSVQKRERNRVEEMLFANPNTKNFRANLYSHIQSTGLSEDDQVKLATLLTTLGGQALASRNIPSTVQTMAALLPLYGKIPNAKLAETATIIRLYVKDGQEITAAQHIAKTAKTAEGIDSIFEKPIPGVEMTQEWHRRTFQAFTDAGFRSSNNIGLLCAEIRGRINLQQQEAVAVMFSRLYASGRKEVPGTYINDVQFVAGLMEKGFTPQAAESALGIMKSTFKPGQIADASELVIPRIKPSMKELEIRQAIESVAFENRDLAAASWAKTADPRLIFMGEKIAISFSESLRKVASQEEYDARVEMLASFAQKWNAEVKPIASADVNPIISQLSPVYSLDALQHLSPEGRAEVLFALMIDVSPRTYTETRGRGKNRRTITRNPRAEALTHINGKFEGKTPSAEEVVKEMGEFLRTRPKYRK